MISSKYECTDMTMNLVGDFIYANNQCDIFKYNVNTKEIENITNGKYTTGINKMQYYDGYLYFYTYGTPSYIKRLNVQTGEDEDILEYNEGDFWYDCLLVKDDCIIFTGCQNTALKEGEPEQNFVRGTYKYSFADKKVYKIYDEGLGPTLCIMEDYVIFIVTFEDYGADKITILDYNGNNIGNEFPNLIA